MFHFDPYTISGYAHTSIICQLRYELLLALHLFSILRISLQLEGFDLLAVLGSEVSSSICLATVATSLALASSASGTLDLWLRLEQLAAGGPSALGRGPAFVSRR